MRVNSRVSSHYTNFKTVVFVVDLLIWKDFIMLTTVLHSVFLKNLVENKVSVKLRNISFCNVFFWRK